MFSSLILSLIWNTPQSHLAAQEHIPEWSEQSCSPNVSNSWCAILQIKKKGKRKRQNRVEVFWPVKIHLCRNFTESELVILQHPLVSMTFSRLQSPIFLDSSFRGFCLRSFSPVTFNNHLLAPKGQGRKNFQKHMCTLLANSSYKNHQLLGCLITLSCCRSLLFIFTSFFVLILLFQIWYGTQNEYEILALNKAFWVLTHMVVL